MTGPELDNRRVAAAVVDLGVLFAMGIVLGILAGGYAPGVEAVATGWALFYYFALESGTGQTLGKRLLGLRVTDERGEKPRLAQIAMRTLLRLVDGIGLYLVGLVVMLVTGKRRQRLGDVVAHTVVTTADSAPAGDAEPASEPPEEERAPDTPALVDPAPEEPLAVEPVLVEPGPFEPEPVEPEPAPVHEEAAPVEPAPEEPLDAESPVVEPLAAAVPLAVPLEDEPDAPQLDQAAAAPAEEQPVVPVKRMEIVSPIELIMGSMDESKAEADDEPGDSGDGEQPAL